MSLWIAVILLGGLFSIVHGIVDLRAKRFVWGGLAIFVGLMLILTPVPTFEPMMAPVTTTTH